MPDPRLPLAGRFAFAGLLRTSQGPRRWLATESDTGRRVIAVATEAEPASKLRDPRGAVPVAAKPSPKDDKGASEASGRPEDPKTRKRREAEARQKKSAKLGPLEKEVAKLEDRIGTLEAEQKTRSAELSDPTVYDDAARRNKLLSDYQSAQEKLEELSGRWEQAMSQLEAAKAELARES